MWKIMEAKEMIESIYLPISLADYNLFRNMYHGGRVLPTIASYDTLLWKEGGASPFLPNPGYDNEEGSDSHFNWPEGERERWLADELKMVDVVSLYPYVMLFNKYPIGKYTKYTLPVHRQEEEASRISRIIQNGKYSVVGQDNSSSSSSSSSSHFVDDAEEFVHKVENLEYSALKERMFRCCYQVDMCVERPILVAFLIRKNEESGSPEQSLRPFEDYWVTGVELFEAIKVGYTLQRVKSVIAWPRAVPVFKNYISALFKIKEANKHDKSSAMYIAAKVWITCDRDEDRGDECQPQLQLLINSNSNHG